MKIILATGIFIPEVGGPPVYVPALAGELVKLGHEVIVATYSDEQKYDGDGDFPFKVVRIKRTSKAANYFNYFINTWKLSETADIIYAFDYFSAGIPALLAAKLRRRKLIIRNGGDLIWERHLSRTGAEITLRDFYKCGLHRKYFFKLFIAKLVFWNADRIIFSSKMQGEIFIKYYSLAADRVRYINNPVPKRISAIKDIGSNKDILFAGRMIPKNNLIRLVRVFCDLDNNDFRLMLIGEGSEKDKLVAIAKDKKCEDKVIFRDRIERELHREKIANSYGFIIPSYTDITPNSALDCIAAGTPFIITKEHGYDWLRGKMIEFNPTDDEDLKKSLLSFMNSDIYNNLLAEIKKIDYDYSFASAAADTLKIMNEIKA